MVSGCVGLRRPRLRVVAGLIGVVAVAATIASDPTPDIPGTALKLHPAAELHVDREAAGA